MYYRIKKDLVKTLSDNTYNNDLPLAYHLYKEHNCTKQNDLNNFYRFTIVQHCTPSDLDVAGHKWIHRLKTL